MEQSVREISPLIGRLLNVEPVRGPVRKYVSTYRRLQLVGKLNFHRPIVSANRSLVLISVDVSGPPPPLPPPIVASPDYYPCTGYATRRRSAGRYLIKYIEEHRRFFEIDRSHFVRRGCFEVSNKTQSCLSSIISLIQSWKYYLHLSNVFKDT